MNNHVKIAVRWRPPTENRELAIVKVNSKVINVGKNFQTFLLDDVIDSCDQTEVYNILGKPLVDKAFEGYDCTLLASGQSGSGKTYTMGFERSVNPENNGITARILNSIFSYDDAKQTKVLISFVEIYNEQVFDLFGENPQKPYYTKDNRTSEATKKSVKSENEVHTLLSMAVKQRHVRKTNINSISSRSHVIFSIYLGIEHRENVIRESVINLVDLAGSEGFRKTGNTGQAQAEGKMINESLSAFKRVINSMSHRESHIPYRDAAITMILRNSLHTRSYLTLLGCVSPYQDEYGETLSTLRFLADAKTIKKTPELNAVISEFQKSKTPVKRLLQTPDSFKRPLPMSTIQNKLSFSRQYSEPRIKRPSDKNLAASARSNWRSSTYSTTKKNSFGRRRVLYSEKFNRSKAVTSLFPTSNCNTTATSQQNNESFDINFCNASTSSIIDFKPLDNDPNASMINPMTHTQTANLHSYLNYLSKDGLPSLMSIVRENTVNRPPLSSTAEDMIKVVIDGITEMMNRNLNQSELNAFIPTASDPVLSPLIEREWNGSTKDRESDQHKEKSIEDQNPAIDSSNIVDDVDAATLVQVKTTPNITSTQNCQQALKQCIENSYIHTINKTLDMLYEESPTVQNDVQNGIIARKSLAHRVSVEPVHSPLGVMRFRKVDFHKDNSDKSIIYEVVMPQLSEVNHKRDEIDETPITVDNSLCEGPQNDGYSLNVSSTVATRSRTKDIRLPFSPRIILNRINSIEEYNSKESPLLPITTNKRKRRQTKKNTVQVLKVKTNTSQTNHSQKILKILNTGTEKDIQKLPTIGAKRAHQIFTNRSLYGGFRTIDALERMQFWTEKIHQKFLNNNDL